MSYTRPTMLMEVTCRCGWSTRGSEAEVIANITTHARAEHDLKMTPDDVRRIWRRVGNGTGTEQRRNAR